MSAQSRQVLNVLVATPLGPGGKGGIDRVMDNLCAALATGKDGASMRALATRGCGSSPMMVPVMAKFLATLLSDYAHKRLDVVHLNVSQRGSIVRKSLVATVCRRLGIPYVVHVHGSQFHLSWETGGPAVRRRMQRLLGGAAQIVVLGTFWRDTLLSMGANPARLNILPNATRHPLLANRQMADKPCRILFLGQMSPRKGVPQLVEALHSLSDQGGWEATLAGDGEVEQTRAKIAALGLADRVRVNGWANPADVMALQETHDILVLPSFNENLPMSVIEGMAYGMAVIATPVGAVQDIIEDGQSGLLVPPGDVAALAAALRRCIADAGLRQALGLRARAYHAQYLNLDDYAQRVVAIWRAALPAKSSPVGRTEPLTSAQDR